MPNDTKRRAKPQLPTKKNRKRAAGEWEKPRREFMAALLLVIPYLISNPTASASKLAELVWGVRSEAGERRVLRIIKRLAEKPDLAGELADQVKKAVEIREKTMAQSRLKRAELEQHQFKYEISRRIKKEYEKGQKRYVKARLVLAVMIGMVNIQKHEKVKYNLAKDCKRIMSCDLKLGLSTCYYRAEEEVLTLDLEEYLIEQRQLIMIWAMVCIAQYEWEAMFGWIRQ
ncbi:MAG: hypothetical protein HPY50_03905 [Firmicutes bacterium]|nr:hypothetical protein [Bacillota bacterium]